MKVAIIGGGAAGFFAALAVKDNHEHANVVIFEKSNKLLSKVKVSGGGRCNVTNGTTSIKELSDAYPRGGKQLKKAFAVFNTKHTMEWFEKRGVQLYTQEDNCVFPVSQDSQTIIDCFLNEARKHCIRIETRKGISAIQPNNSKIDLTFDDKQVTTFDKVIVATGGSPKRKGLEWLEALGHKIANPVPSLFTFNMPQETVRELMGIAVTKAQTSIQGTNLKAQGPLLITHWGMSGPAILKLSAFGARILHDMGYTCKLQLSWVNELSHEKVMEELRTIVKEHPNKLLTNYRPYDLPERLWLYLLDRSQLPVNQQWKGIGKKGLNKLISVLTNDIYAVKGKTTFKEEFVTCGGISLESIDFSTMKSKVCRNLYFAGEIMDVDGITGGYNFQAAWTTAFIAGKLD